MRLSKRERVFIIAAAAAVFALIYYNYFLHPHLERYMALKEVTDSRTIELGRLREILERMDQVKKDIEGSKSTIASLEEVIPSNKKLPEVIVKLEQMAVKSGVEIRGMTFRHEDSDRDNENNKQKDAGKQEYYLEIPISLEVAGGYKQIISFLREMEASERLIVLDKILLARNAQDKGGLTANISVQTYVLKHSGSILEDPSSFPFMGGQYGKEDPFAPLIIEEEKGGKKDMQNYEKPVSEREIIDTFMEEFIKMLLE